MEVEQRKRGQPHLHVQPGGPPVRIRARCYHASGHLSASAAERCSVQVSLIFAAVRVTRRTRAKCAKRTN